MKKKSRKAIDLKVNERKGIPSDNHWQINVPVSAEGFGNDPKGAFLPRPAKNRAVPHQKINETDY